MKKLISILLVLAMLVSMAACSSGGGDTKPPVNKPTDPKALYQDFLAGKVMVYRGNYEWIKEQFDYSSDDWTTTEVLEQGEGVTIEDFIFKLLDANEDIPTQGKIDDVSYAYIDCGNDGVPELAVKVTSHDTFDDSISFTAIIKEFEGKLKLCYIASDYYRASEWLQNKYGVFMGSDSYSGYLFSSNYGFLDADCEYHPVYVYYDDFDFGYEPEMHGEKFAQLTEDDRAYLVDQYDAVFTELLITNDGDFSSYYYYDPMTKETAEIFSRIGVEIVAPQKLDEISNKAKLDAGLTQEIADDTIPVEWIKVDSEVVTNYVKYGYHPVFVSTVEEFVKAVDHNTTVVLAPGTYNLTEYIDIALGTNAIERLDVDAQPDAIPGAYVTERPYSNLTLYSLYGLTIMSADANNPAELIVLDEDAHVMDFYGCGNLRLENIKAGHDALAYGCTSEVLGFDFCETVNIVGCDLYGCGTYGFIAEGCYYVNVIDTCIHDCSSGAVHAYNCTLVDFMDCKFENIVGNYAFTNYDSDFSFYNCSFKSVGIDLLYMSGEYAASHFSDNCTFDSYTLKSLENYRGEGYLYY